MSEIPGFYYDPVRNRYFAQTRDATPNLLPSETTEMPESLESPEAVEITTKTPISAYSHLFSSQISRISRRNTTKMRNYNFYNFKEVNEIQLSQQIQRISHKIQICTRNKSNFLVGGLDGDGIYSLSNFDLNLNVSRTLLRHTSPFSGISSDGEKVFFSNIGDASNPGTFGVLNLFSGQNSVRTVNTTIWTSQHIGNETLCLGIEETALLFNIQRESSFELKTGRSDVFAIENSSEINDFFIGTRNGSVLRYNLRRGKRSTGKVKCSSSVVRINQCDNYFTVSCLDGYSALYDVRMLSSGSVQVYSEHVNTYVRDLGDMCDFVQDVHILCGSDRILRCWRISSGELLWQIPSKELVRCMEYFDDANVLFAGSEYENRFYKNAAL